jgi:predicted SprT family Zn-dependent metalloprotease
LSWYVPDAGLPVPSAQKPVTRRRGKQKAPKKPYTPRKKKTAATEAAAKRPRKPYTPRKKKDVVPAGATAAAENDQTLQQVVIHALCHCLLASKLQRDAPWSI